MNSVSSQEAKSREICKTNLTDRPLINNLTFLIGPILEVNVQEDMGHGTSQSSIFANPGTGAFYPTLFTLAQLDVLMKKMIVL
jgi:hypothetical protein